MGKLGIAALAAALLLTGCAAQDTEPETTPTPTASAPANAASCEKFRDVTMTLGSAFTGESTKDDWEEIRVEMDTVALTATGEVKTRLDTLVNEWPNYADIIVYKQIEPFNDLLHSVGRACTADGTDVEYNYLVTG